MLITRHQRGFNLIEVAVTVSVLALLVATAGPGMIDFVRSAKLRSLAEATQNGLQRARSEALKRNQVVTFWLVSPSNTASPDNTCALASDSAAWVVSVDNPAGQCAAAPSATDAPRIVEVYGPGAAGNNILVSGMASDSTAATSVSFNGFGQRVGTGTLAKLDISSSDGGSRVLRIEVSPSGGIRMCDRAFVAPDPRACTTS